MIRITRTDQIVCVDVHDEGKGIPSEKLTEIQLGTSGLGIRGMRERVILLGGQMIIQSEGGGTTISVTLPLEKLAN